MLLWPGSPTLHPHILMMMVLRAHSDSLSTSPACHRVCAQPGAWGAWLSVVPSDSLLGVSQNGSQNAYHIAGQALLPSRALLGLDTGQRVLVMARHLGSPSYPGQQRTVQGLLPVCNSRILSPPSQCSELLCDRTAIRSGSGLDSEH